MNLSPSFRNPNELTSVVGYLNLNMFFTSVKNSLTLMHLVASVILLRSTEGMLLFSSFMILLVRAYMFLSIGEKGTSLAAITRQIEVVVLVSATSSLRSSGRLRALKCLIT